LPSSGRLHILQSLAQQTYEKICLIFNHRLNRHRVYRFLRTTAWNDCDFDHSGSHQISIAIADPQEESHDQEEEGP
jgi:hypothetical protein